MGFNQRRMDRERAAAQRAEKERRERGRDVAQARKLVAIWNSRAGRGARRNCDARRGAVAVVHVPGVPDSRRNRCRHARSPSRDVDFRAHSVAVVPSVLRQSTFRQTLGVDPAQHDCGCASQGQCSRPQRAGVSEPRRLP